MNEIAIKRHSFDVAKNRLKEFSEKTEAELEIDKVRTDGGFLGLGDHKVTGYELNRRLETIQEHFIAVNTTNNKVIKEFREVYNALDVLDKDYITSIVANVKAIEKTSNDVRVQQGTLKQHNEKLVKQQSKLDAHQVEIEKNVANISKIVTALKVFKEKLESYKHLTDIDKIWNDCKSIQNEIRVVSESNTKFSKKVAEDIATIEKSLQNIESDILKMKKHLDEIDSFVSDINGYTHLQDIDNMWDDLDSLATTSEKHTESIVTLFKNLADTEKYAVDSRNLIVKLEAFREKVSEFNHFDDVDDMWKDVEEHTSKFIECEKKDEELITAIKNNKDEVDLKIAEVIQQSNNAIEALTKKVKYAYWIAGGAVGISIVELILLLMKVI